MVNPRWPWNSQNTCEANSTVTSPCIWLNWIEASTMKLCKGAVYSPLQIHLMLQESWKCLWWPTCAACSQCAGQACTSLQLLEALRCWTSISLHQSIYQEVLWKLCHGHIPVFGMPSLGPASAQVWTPQRSCLRAPGCCQTRSHWDCAPAQQVLWPAHHTAGKFSQIKPIWYNILDLRSMQVRTWRQAHSLSKCPLTWLLWCVYDRRSGKGRRKDTQQWKLQDELDLTLNVMSDKSGQC